MKQVYWILVNDERYCSFDNYQDAKFMLDYLKARGTADKLELMPDAGKDER